MVATVRGSCAVGITAHTNKRVRNFICAMRYYKKRLGVVMLATALLSGMVAFCASDTWQNAEGMTKNVMKQIDDICYVGRVEKVADLLSVTFSEDILCIAGHTINNTRMLRSMNDILTGISFCFCVLTFFASFINIREQDMTSEQLVLKLALFGACIVLIFKAQDICLGIANIGTGLAIKAAGLTSSDAEAAREAEALISDVKQLAYEQCKSEDDGLFAGLMEFIAALGVYLQLMLPSLSMWAVSIVTNVICWSRAFEIVILSTFSPVAFADATGIDHFGQGGGSRFIKNVLALSISGAIIVFIMSLNSGVSLSILKNTLNGSFDEFVVGVKDLLVVSFAQVGLVLKAQSMAKTLCGAG